MIVADASALGDYLIHQPQRQPDSDLHTPELCDLELLAALRRFVRNRRLTVAAAETAIIDYLALPLTRHGHSPLIGRIFELRDNFSAYDAAYVALAESLGADLWTADQRLARAVRRHLPHVALA